MLRLQLSTESKQSRHQRQTASMFPAFALQLSCPAQTYSISGDADKTHVEFADWVAVSKVFAAAVVNAWSAVASNKMLAEALQDSANEELPLQRLCNTIEPSPAASQRYQQASAPLSTVYVPSTMQKFQQPPHTADNHDAQQDIGFSTLLPAAAMNRIGSKIASFPAARSQLQAARNSACTDSQQADMDADSKHSRLGFLPHMQSSAKMRIPIKTTRVTKASL